MNSTIKKSLITAAVATNALTLTNSFMIIKDTVQENGEAFELATASLAAPLVTYVNWRESNNPSFLFGGSPLARVANVVHEYAARPVDGLLCAYFTLVGAPGAIIGHLGGSIVGGFTPQDKKAPEPAPL